MPGRMPNCEHLAARSGIFSPTPASSSKSYVYSNSSSRGSVGEGRRIRRGVHSGPGSGSEHAHTISLVLLHHARTSEAFPDREGVERDELEAGRKPTKVSALCHAL